MIMALHPMVNHRAAPPIALLMLAAGAVAMVTGTASILALAWRAIRP